MNHSRPRLFETSRNTFHSALLLVSSNSRHAQTIDCQREGKGQYTGRDLKQLGREREWERYKTIGLIAQIQPLHVGMQSLGHFSAVVSRNRTWKPQFLSFVELVNVRAPNYFNLDAALKTKLLIFHIHTPSGKTKWNARALQMTQIKKKQMRKVKNSAAVSVDVPLLAA